MKKFFSILLTAVLALVSVPSCGGGGDKEVAMRMTAEQFKAGSKYFEFWTSAGSLFVYPESGEPPYTADSEYTDAAGNKVKQVYAVQGTVKLGLKGDIYKANFAYTVTENAEGLPIEAVLSLGLRDPIEEDDELTQFLGIQGIAQNPDDDDNADGGNAGGGDAGGGNAGPVIEMVDITINYDSKRFDVNTAETTGNVLVYPQ